MMFFFLFFNGNMDFRARVTPSREFESYTPNELMLKRLTVDNRTWEKQVESILRRPLQGELLDRYFRHYINKHFPLTAVDAEDFAKFVLEEERKRGEPVYSEYTRTWHASLPGGQRHFSYPIVDTREEPDSFNMFLERR